MIQEIHHLKENLKQNIKGNTFQKPSKEDLKLLESILISLDLYKKEKLDSFIYDLVDLNIIYFDRYIWSYILRKIPSEYLIMDINKTILEKYFLIDNEKIITIFSGNVLCSGRLFIGWVILTGLRLFAISSAIQVSRNLYEATTYEKLIAIRTKVSPTDTFLNKLNNQSIRRNINLCKNVHYFPVENVLKKKTSENVYKYRVIFYFEEKGEINNRKILIKIRPKKSKLDSYKAYKEKCQKIFSILDSIIKVNS